jgi:ATP-dependent DNA helicase DinG
MAEKPVAPRLLLPEVPALVAGQGRAVVLDADGSIETLPARTAAARLTESAPLLVHAPATARRLGVAGIGPAHDLLELFAFALPAASCAPTPRGLALALGLPLPRDDEAAVALLPDIATELLRRLADDRAAPLNRDAASLAARMGEAGWPWARSVLAALGAPAARSGMEGLRVWRRLPEWEEAAPANPPSSFGIEPNEARARLAQILGEGAEQRPQQADYASAAAAAFAPREDQGAPALVLAEAGTGTGKTLGYVAPASLWAERNGAPVWISTFTRNLQRQIDQETARLFPDPEERRRRVVLRKGRENYLCLLNLEDALGFSAMPGQGVALGLVARWAAATRDGDILGGDFPGWITELFGPSTIMPLADRRGECIHAACPHYRKCFVEHSIRRARGASIVIANHALVMIQAALGGGEDGRALRLVFDEGHHLFDAADSAFSADLTGAEMAELRRWILGAEGGRSRARGLKRRLEELIGEKPELQAPLEAALQAARALPAGGWSGRLTDEGALDLVGAPANPAEAFLRAVRRQVRARSAAAEEAGLYDAECDLFPLNADIAEIASALERALQRLEAPVRHLREKLLARMEDEAAEIEANDRLRIEAICGSLERRVLMPLGAWRAMLVRMGGEEPAPGARPDMVDWLSIERRGGQDSDAGMHRHWLDPTIPFAMQVAAPAHGVLITSATLRDAADAEEDDPEAAWREAEGRTGAVHLPLPAIRAAVASPFDYAARTRCIVVTDVARENTAQIAGAMRELFLAAGGGALGLFTAIRRLRDVHARMAPALEEAGLPLYAQHIDAMDNATLVDVFRAEENSCLLGTDAMRDGVDVPGRSLRLLVFDRVPWPRPSILNRERRLHLSEGRPKEYDDRITRHRLRQAFGRLIRRADDKGVFVMLDRSCPSRLLAGLPSGVLLRRMGLADAAREVREFLG